MGNSAAVGKDEQVARKVEGLVVRLDRGSSNLPGRIGKPRKRRVFAVGDPVPPCPVGTWEYVACNMGHEWEHSDRQPPGPPSPG